MKTLAEVPEFRHAPVVKEALYRQAVFSVEARGITGLTCNKVSRNKFSVTEQKFELEWITGFLLIPYVIIYVANIANVAGNYLTIVKKTFRHFNDLCRFLCGSSQAETTMSARALFLAFFDSLTGRDITSSTHTRRT